MAKNFDSKHEEKIKMYKNFGMKEHVYFEIKMPYPDNYRYYRAWNVEKIQEDLLRYRKESNDPDRFRIGGAWYRGNSDESKESYDKEANWIAPMWNIIPDGIELINTHGIYDSVKNKNGVSRDHMYSKKSGHINGVFPEILRHPANCEIIFQKLNVKKNKKNSHTLQELMFKILDYDKPWPEQNLAVKRIEEYLNGERFKYKVIIRNSIPDIFPDLTHEEIEEYSPGLFCFVGEKFA